MKFDFNDFNDLDVENIGSWPKYVKTVFAIMISAIVFIVSYFFVVSDAINVLAQEEDQELQLRHDFKMKYQLAANLPLYLEQLTVMETQFSELLKMLPSKNEMPSLLDDLTFVATDSGLKMSSLSWQKEIDRGFYIEFPINMSVKGSYHQIGKMVGAVAKLPRIVSLHDFSITQDDAGQLNMNIQAKTYRFKEDT